MEGMLLEPLLSAMVDKLFERLVSPEFLNFIRGKKFIDNDQLNELNIKLRKARVLLNDAEERQLEEERVREWMDDLKDVIYRAQDLVDEIDYEVLSKKLEPDFKAKWDFRIKKMKSKFITSFSKSDKTVQGDSKCRTSFQIKEMTSNMVSSFSRSDKTHVKDEVAKILKNLDLLLENQVGRDLKVEDAHKYTTPTGATSKRHPAPWPQETYVRGRGADKDKIMDTLLPNDVWGGKVGVLPIVGMGGLGKTTLAQLVYNDGRWEEHDFALRAWVTVSTDFDVYKIMKIILDQVSPGNSRHNSEEPTAPQLALNEALKDKKFLIVLDDVWDEDYSNWNVLRSTFGFGKCESRVIVTTRSNTVASNVKTGPIYELQQVSKDHCWQIFVDHAFDGDSNADRHLQEIGRKLVEKCGGLPLALTSLGGLLRSERDPKNWERVLNSDVWVTKKILPSLWLSYRYLPSCLKQCFAYCSMFPKNYEYKKDVMVLLWMAEGFLQSDQSEKKMEEVGEEYLNNLISRSLFQGSSENTFVVHDLLHDLAMFVSREFGFALDEDKNLKHVTSKTRHFFNPVSKNCDEYLREVLSKAKNLRTLVGRFSDAELEYKLLASTRCLRVLCPASFTRITLLPNFISNLKHLRYLSLSYSDVQVIPSAICTLYNLQTLLLSGCTSLTKLPNDMKRLINLRHLDTSLCPLVAMPPRMGNLRELQTLTDFVLGKHDQSSTIKELGELRHLGGTLRISGLQNVNNVEDVQNANLRDKKNLRELVLKWEGDTTDAVSGKEVLDALQPHTNLKALTIHFYTGLNFPSWVGDSEFSNVVTMQLIESKYCCSLPPLGQLHSLRDLHIKSFHGVKTIDAEFYGNILFTTPFQSLKNLTFEDMPNLNKLLVIEDEREGGCFPRLEKLSLVDCPNIIGSLPDRNNTLKDLLIRGCNSIKSLSLDFPCLKRLILDGCPSVTGSLPVSNTMVELKILGSCKFMESFPLNHYPSLKTLELSECHSFESIKAFSEESGPAVVLWSLCLLRLDGCQNLRSLPQNMHMLLPSLACLKIYNCPEIGSFPEAGLPSNLSVLKIRSCRKLVARHMHWDLQGLSSLGTLEIGGCDLVLDSFPEGLLPVSLSSFILENFPHLKSLNGSAFQHFASLDELRLSDCKEVQCLPEEVLRPNFLRTLSIMECPILEQRYQKDKGKDWHKISHIETSRIGTSDPAHRQDKLRIALLVNQAAGQFIESIRRDI